MAEPDPRLVADLAEQLAASSKYGSLAQPLLERTSAWALERHARPKDAAKAARRKLHQVHSAFVTDRQLAEAERLLAGLAPDAAWPEVTAVCRRVLALHTSTAERVPYLRELYEAAFGGLGAVREVVDLGGGLSAFAWPWMGLDAGTRYVTLDVDRRFAQLTMQLAEYLPAHIDAETVDLVALEQPVRADVVLLLKVLPSLERQRHGAARRILELVDAKRVVVSLPTRSLGGRDKGMSENYERQLDAAIPAGWKLSERHIFPRETLYLLDR